MSRDQRPSFLEFLAQQVVVFDGAMGTSLQQFDLSLDDFDGAEGCNEVLVRTRPDVVQQVHQRFMAAGCHVLETNTFGANRVVLAEYDLAAEAEALNRRAARLARQVADDHSSPHRPRYVAGSMGPGTKLPSLGHITFDELVLSYREQAAGLLDGGADLLLVETCQDILQTRAAVLAARREATRRDRAVPLMISLTMEVTGTMLLGTELSAALAALIPLRPDLLGLNCATGPLEMKQHIRALSRRCPLPISALPNAGLPQNIGGQTVYPLTPDAFARWLAEFVSEDGVAAVGGCCGTTPEHLARAVEAVECLTPATRKPTFEPSLSSLYHAVPLEQEPKPLLVGERTNANGSKKFRKLLLADDYDGMVDLARGQERGGAHALDLCTAYVGRDEVLDITEAVSRLAQQVSLPLMIDSTQSDALEAALKLCGGRCVINSINFEDGEAKAREVLQLAKDHGAAVVALVIDEQGMARTVEQKLKVAHRIHALAVGEFGLRPEDLLLDMLTFTVASGDETLRDAAVTTLEAIERTKAELPGVNTLLGVSNISFGLKPRARHVLNSVFLQLAVERGLDAAIVEARKIISLSRIDEPTRRKAEDLLLNRRDHGDPLMTYIHHFEDRKDIGRKIPEAEDTRGLTERLHRKVVDGDRSGLNMLLAAEVTRRTPLEIINGVLIPAMKEVGELFGSGQMQLPFVLQSAEVMKRAVAFLEPLMDKADTAELATLVLATVKGDVHDIGKNLVDILLSNNGFRVINLGIKVPIEEMVRVFEEEKADAIGMSGLLVKSTLIMKENLDVLRRRGITPPVLLGGAALTRSYVEKDLRGLYGPGVHYGKDAFDGLTLMQRLAEGELEGGDPDAHKPDGATPANVQQALDGGLQGAYELETPPSVEPCAELPERPFLGARTIEIPTEELFPLINEAVLFRGRWQYRRGKMSAEKFANILEKEAKPAFDVLKKRMLDEHLLRPRGVYGYFECLSDGNDLQIVEDAGGTRRTIRFPRRRKAPHHCIADFFQPLGSKTIDTFGCFVVTVGERATREANRLFEAHKYRDYLQFHGLAVEAAEAAAEWLHRTMRQEMGIDQEETNDPVALARQAYRGSRYSFGYPACPNLEDQAELFGLLDPAQIGVTLTENAQMVPEQSVSAFVVHHPKAKYFAV